MTSGLVIDEGALAALGVAVGDVFITLAVILSLATLADKAYRVITKDGKTYDFRFLNDELFINNTLIKAFTSTISVITSFFDDHLTANPNEEVTDPDAGSGDTAQPSEDTGDTEQPKITSDDINWNIDDNLIHHIANGSKGNHREPWKNFGINPDDPDFYLTVLPFLKQVIDEGRIQEESVVTGGKIIKYIKEFADRGYEIIVKIFIKPDGEIVLSDAYVKTR